MRSLSRALTIAAAAAPALGAVPSVPLYNAAAPGMTMPAVGLGTGGYGALNLGYGVYPECWGEIFGCGNYTIRAVSEWLRLGGRRLDAADSYDTQVSVGIAMAASGVPREDIFLLQKTGSWNTMGYNDTLLQMEIILEQMNVTYVDLLLNHWPTSPASPTIDPVCDPARPSYDPRACRMHTWAAMMEIWGQGKAKAIGVANYNSSHIQELLDAGLPLPAVNQIPVHLYNARAQADTIAFCRSLNITVLAYSPLGVPDWHAYPTPALPSNTTLADPVVAAVAATHGVPPARVILAWLWQQGIPYNPRSMNATHMLDNMKFDLVLSDAEMEALSSRPIDTCVADPNFYECVPAQGRTPPAYPRQH